MHHLNNNDDYNYKSTLDTQRDLIMQNNIASRIFVLIKRDYKKLKITSIHCNACQTIVTETQRQVTTPKYTFPYKL